MDFPISEKNRREGDLTTSELEALYASHGLELEAAREQLAVASSDQARSDATKLIGWYTSRQNRILAEIWKRRAIALSIFTFPFLGFPISMTMRYRHRMVSFFMGSALTLVIFYPTLVAGETLAESGTLPAPIALLSGNLLLIGISTLLCGRLFFR